MCSRCFGLSPPAASEVPHIRGNKRTMPWPSRMNAALITFTVSGIGRFGSITWTMRMASVTSATPPTRSTASRRLP